MPYETNLQISLTEAIAKFDRLVQKGEIQLVHSDPVFITEDGFTVLYT
jgi:hypothetical protein